MELGLVTLANRPLSPVAKSYVNHLVTYARSYVPAD